MTASRSERQRKLQEQAGPVGKATVKSSRTGELVYAISCLEHCQLKDMSGRTYRTGKPNGYRDALKRWALHLAYAHPDSSPPCMSMLEEAREETRQKRAQEAKEAEEITALIARWETPNSAASVD